MHRTDTLIHHPAVAAARRCGHPDEVAGAVAWLGSDLASFVTGTSVLVDGGLTAVI